MDRVQEGTAHQSYFWKCLTLDEDCPFFSRVDTKLYYFGVVLACLYGAFLLMILADLKFYWTMDSLQQQIDFYINLVKKKVRYVQMNQRRLETTQDRTEKQLKKSEDCQRMVTAIRGALVNDELNHLTLRNMNSEETFSPNRRSVNDFYPILNK